MTSIIELTQDQARQVVVTTLCTKLFVHKQYLSRHEIENYKYVLHQFATLLEIDEARRRFNRIWPQEVTWDPN